MLPELDALGVNVGLALGDTVFLGVFESDRLSDWIGVSDTDPDEEPDRENSRELEGYNDAETSELSEFEKLGVCVSNELWDLLRIGVIVNNPDFVNTDVRDDDPLFETEPLTLGELFGLLDSVLITELLRDIIELLVAELLFESHNVLDGLPDMLSVCVRLFEPLGEPVKLIWAELLAKLDGLVLGEIDCV